MNNAVLGPAAGQPFCNPHFATFNRARWFGEAYPLVVDWCNKTFTATEKVTIRKVFIRWVHKSLNYNVLGGGGCCAFRFKTVRASFPVDWLELRP